ncbi:MAG: tetratricopeptide repeat protein [Proteobacteria bacterium]|nr:tetratricopeptide repeat protein [Pseudomonadota bacterium]
MKPRPPPPVLTRNNPDALVAAGFERHRRGDVAGAAPLYAQALKLKPDHPDALHLSGLVARAYGRHDEALAKIVRACALVPGNAHFEANLAAALITVGRPDEALAAADRAIAALPGHAAAHANRAAALAALERPDDAATSYRRAIELDPASVDAFNNLANLEQRRGNLDVALDLYVRALAAAPDHPHVHSNYGTAIYALHVAGRKAEAAERAAAWRAAHPDSPTARHWAAALAGQAAPSRAEDGYVRGAFDLFAATFDQTLASVGYSAPEGIRAMLETQWGTPSPRFVTLDAGCGTGLAGLVLRPWSTRLEGVDLSHGMLARAQDRAIYDELRAGELVADLDAHRRSYDVIVAADVFCYFGIIDEALAAARRALKAGGHIVFSTETMLPDEQGDWKVRPSGRYAHARAYIEKAVAAAGFTPLQWRVESPRAEDGKPIPGLIVMAAG